MSIELITILMFSSLIILLLAGLPVAFATGSLAVIFISLPSIFSSPSRCLSFWRVYSSGPG